MDNGSLSVSSRRAATGSTVIITVTPDEGYELSALTVAGANGGLLALTDRGSGRYAFTMPACAVTVSASFSKISDAAGGVPFTDLSAGAYYYDAVLWAVTNGITNGASASAFYPDGGCTRAQVVTFLWRAAGSPSPASSSNPFADVSPDAYYYDAVLWAVENGVTNGTSGASFSPDATVTRAQAVTFLWRYAGAPAGDAGSPFTDVVPGAYYEAAVAWAVASGVTNGITAAAVGPNDPCTRAHIVTFLYRSAEK